MHSAPTDRDRWLALGLLLLLLTLGYALLVHPLWTAPLLAVNDQIDTLKQRDARQRGLIQQASAITARLNEVRAMSTAGTVPGFMAQTTPEQATAALAQQLEAAVAQASPGNRSCIINNRSPMEAPADGKLPYRRVVLQVRLQCGDPELATALHLLESGNPRLFVNNLVVFSQSGYGEGMPNQGLDASFDLTGYLPAVADAADAGQEASDGA